MGWTSLFIKAGVIVAEEVGLLAHSLIIAREYAIVSVPGLRKLTDNITDAVDDY